MTLFDFKTQAANILYIKDKQTTNRSKVSLENIEISK